MPRAHHPVSVKKLKELSVKSTRALLSVAWTIGCALASCVFAQAPAPPPAGPVPPAVVNAKSIFISNSGSDIDLFPGIYSEGHQLSYLFNGDEDRPYSEFFSALAATGDYKLPSDPSQADLVLELQLRAHPAPELGAPGPLAELRLIVYGGQSHYVLWTITQAIEPANLQKNRDKNFDEAVTNLLNRFLQVAGKLPVPAH
jgi:hypothetical protein